jgi:RHS repeat-associated protein
VGFGYDAVGNRDDLVYPDPSAGSGQAGGTVTYTYDALNQLTQVEDWDAGTAAYGYDLGGRMVTATLPNGTETAYSYDDANRLTQIEHRESGGDLLARYVYELDGVGNRVKATETISTPGTGLITTTITYTYDSLYRLTEADYSSGENFQYVYDAVGNRTSYTATITSTQNTTYSYDAANRLVNVSGVAYTWDDLGRLTHDGTYSFTWDAASRLITVTDGVTTIGFRYDGDGNRLAEIVNGTLTTHTLDVGLGLPEVLVAYESAGTVWYLHLLGGVATDDGTAWTYSAADALGSVRQQLDSSGDVESVNSYRPFGSPLEGDGGNPYGFTGEWLESAVGLLYLRARYYNPYLNRFINPDTIVSDFGYPASIHRYLYVFNNP